MLRVSSELVNSDGELERIDNVKIVGLAEINGHLFGLTPIIQDEKPIKEFILVDSESGLEAIDPKYVRFGSRYIHSIGQIGTTDVIKQDTPPAINLTTLVRNMLVKQCLIHEPVEAIEITLHRMENSSTTRPRRYGGSNSGIGLISASQAWTIRINVNTPPEELAKLGVTELLQGETKNVIRSTEIKLPRITAYLFTQ